MINDNHFHEKKLFQSYINLKIKKSETERERERELQLSDINYYKKRAHVHETDQVAGIAANICFSSNLLIDSWKYVKFSPSLHAVKKNLFLSFYFFFL